MRQVNLVWLRKIILTASFLYAGAQLQAEKFDAAELPESLGELTGTFIRAETAKARSLMAKFSDEDLQRITNAFKRAHNGSDQRIFWLVEELYRRNAERVAAERIRYLYSAILAALAVIAAFCCMTYLQTKRLQR